MSSFDRFQWMNGWIDSPDLSVGANAVLAVFMRHMSDTGKAWPSMSTIAEKSGQSKKVARNYVKEAVDAKWIEPRRRTGATTIYLARHPLPESTTPHTEHPFPDQPLPRSGSTPQINPSPDQGVPPKSGSTPSPDRGVDPSPDWTPKQNKGTDLPKREEEGPSTSSNQDLVESDFEKPFTHPQTGEDLSYEELLKVRHPGHLIRALADHFKVPVAAGTETVIWSRTKSEIGNEQKARQYIGAKMTSLGAGDETARKKYSPRGVMEWIPGDAKKWLKNEELPKQELKKRGDVRGTGFMDTDLAKRFT